MNTYTAITTDQTALPSELALLSTPVFFTPEGGGELAGNIRGIVVDAHGHIVFFILEPALDSFPPGERILIPSAGLELGGGVAPGKPGAKTPIARMLWGPEQLRGQPRLSGDAIQPKGQSNTPVPPSGTSNGGKAIRDALYSGAASGAAGAVIGMSVGGPILAAPMGVFFAIGGGIAGAINGGAPEPAADAAHLLDTEPEAGTGTWQIRQVEGAIRDRALYDKGVLRATTIQGAEP